LDDPLSAVDAHVGKHLFEEAIKKYWTGKIVILATNQLQYLPYADNVIFLSNGEVVGDGTFAELVASSPAFKEQMEKYGVGGEKKKEEVHEEKKEEKKETKTSDVKAGPEQSK
jgi:ABC-type multidrug transport system ATPase subunit